MTVTFVRLSAFNWYGNVTFGGEVPIIPLTGIETGHGQISQVVERSLNPATVLPRLKPLPAKQNPGLNH